MEELNYSRIMVIIHTIVAVFVGWFSVQLITWMALAIGILLLFVLGYSTEKFVGKKGIKFWLANGVLIYILIWFVTWIYFLNL